MGIDLRDRLRYIVRVERAVRLVWESGPKWTVASGILVLIQGVLPLASLYLIKLVIDTVSAGMTDPDTDGALRNVMTYVGLAGLVALLSAAVNALAGRISDEQGQRVVDHIHGILHAKSIEVDLAYYEDAAYYDALRRAQSEAPVRPLQIVNGLMSIAQQTVTMIVIAGLLSTFHWLITVILFVAVVPGIFVRVLYADQMYEWKRRRTSSERQASFYDWMLTGSLYAKEVRLFDLGRLFIDRFKDLRRQLREERLAIATRRTIAELVTQFSATIAIYGSYGFIAYRTVQGAATIGDLVMLFQALRQGQSALREMLMGIAGLYENNLFLSNLYEFLDLERKIVEPEKPVAVPHPMQSGIVLDRVGFSYPNGTRKALEDISMAITPGEHVALVGENGSGKTTLIKLLCRLYDPSDGCITLDGIDLRSIGTADLRRGISVVFQDYARYPLPVRENIWFGNVDLPPDQTRIEEAARQADADGVVARLPDGYDTNLGKMFEKGEDLSIGEWQKIALARAFLRDAQIIVLDEPTSALDPKAEYKVFEKFHQLTTGRTAILISHRLSTVRMADRIFVMDQGRIVESGPHEALMANDGLYRQLFETQARYYR